jgi:hypothetical protein
MVNSSDVLLNRLRDIYSRLDIIGASGFAYAFQDKIVSLFDQDQIVYRTYRKLLKIQGEHNNYIGNIFNANPSTQGCKDAFSAVFNGVEATYWSLQDYFMNQYIGDADQLREKFYASCRENNCISAPQKLLSMLNGDGTNCDILQTAYDGQFMTQPYNYQGWRDQVVMTGAYGIDLALIAMSI